MHDAHADAHVQIIETGVSLSFSSQLKTFAQFSPILSLCTPFILRIVQQVVAPRGSEIMNFHFHLPFELPTCTSKNYLRKRCSCWSSAQLWTKYIDKLIYLSAGKHDWEVAKILCGEVRFIHDVKFSPWLFLLHSRPPNSLRGDYVLPHRSWLGTRAGESNLSSWHQEKCPPPFLSLITGCPSPFFSSSPPPSGEVFWATGETEKFLCRGQPNTILWKDCQINTFPDGTSLHLKGLLFCLQKLSRSRRLFLWRLRSFLAPSLRKVKNE